MSSGKQVLLLSGEAQGRGESTSCTGPFLVSYRKLLALTPQGEGGGGRLCLFIDRAREMACAPSPRIPLSGCVCSHGIILKAHEEPVGHSLV